MTRRRLPMNTDNPVEYLAPPDQILHVLRNPSGKPPRLAPDKHPAEFYPALEQKERQK
jgi:hypothetical protein